MTRSAESDVSVVIPGRNCGLTLPACLDALLPLLESGEVREIVFVDDHSTDDSRGVARNYPVKILQSPRRGAGAARNAGFRAVSTEYVWFVDSDCVVERDALLKLRLLLAKQDAAVVGGSYGNHNRGRIVADLIHEEMVARHRAMGELVTFAITANLLCRRDTLEALAGFDESLRLGQDLDFAYRVVRSGRRLGFESSSLVAHFHETRLWNYLVKQARQGFWRVHIYRRHPDRMAGDTYSNVLDHVQPPLALAALFAGAAGMPLGAPSLGWTASLAALLALLASQVPRARALVTSTRDQRLWWYVPFAAARAFFRGVGMVLGISSLFLAPSFGHFQGAESRGVGGPTL